LSSRTIHIAGLAALTVVALTGCGDDDDSSATTTAAPAATSAASTPAASSAPAGSTAPVGTGDSSVPQGLVFGIPSPLATEPGEHNINLGIECYADTIGGRVITVDSNLDVNKQVTDFDQLIAQGAKVLPFLPLDHDAFVGPFDRAEKAGVTVVELYNPDSAAPGSVYENSPSAGEDAVAMVKEQFPDGSKALVIGGPPIPAVTARIGGFVDNADAAGITVLEQQDNLNDNVQDARTLAETLIAKHPDVNVIFGFNDNSAIGAGLAIQAAGIDDVLIFGINGTAEGIEAVKDGVITATYDADQFMMGYQAAEAGAKIQGGASAEPIGLEFKRWTKDNASEWKPADERCE
jgi:ribose transport system substrate-binding protein